MESLRKTKSVKILLNVFKQRLPAISVVELVECLKKEMNKTTVYRILDRLEQNGILHSFLGIGGLKWYAKCDECSSEHHSCLHPHFQCNSCGEVKCLKMELPLPTIDKHKINFACFLLVGQCPDCLS